MTDRTVEIRRALLQQLESWQRAGLGELPRREAIPLPSAPVAAAETAAGVASTDIRSEQPARSEAPRTETSPTEEPPVAKSSSRKKSVANNSADALKILSEEVAGCTLCAELASTRTQTVFGVGNPNARVLFFGEAPGADEDRQGEPFVGRAGQLLTKIIAACTWEREDVYILNTLKCRPPGNRNPAEQELSNCRGYWKQQLEIIQPEFIVCLGKFAMLELLNTPPSQSIGRMRHKFHDYDGEQFQAKVVVTYHPSYLLRNPAAKKDVWDDMKMLLKEMGIKVPKK